MNEGGRDVSEETHEVVRAKSLELVDEEGELRALMGSYPNGSVGKRLKRHGYEKKTYGENIAGGSGRLGAPESIFKRWMESRTHRPNILKRGFREVGIGTATGTFKGNRGYIMYTADFEKRR